MWKIAGLLNDDLDSLSSVDFVWHCCKENALRFFFWSPALVDFSGGMPGSVTNTQTIFDICPRK